MQLLPVILTAILAGSATARPANPAPISVRSLERLMFRGAIEVIKEANVSHHHLNLPRYLPTLSNTLSKRKDASLDAAPKNCKEERSGLLGLVGKKTNTCETYFDIVNSAIGADLDAAKDVARNTIPELDSLFGGWSPSDSDMQKAKKQVISYLSLYLYIYKQIPPRVRNPELPASYAAAVGMKGTSNLPDLNSIYDDAEKKIVALQQCYEKIMDIYQTIRRKIESGQGDDDGYLKAGGAVANKIEKDLSTLITFNSESKDLLTRLQNLNTVLALIWS